MKTLLLIPSILKPERTVPSDGPLMDYHALAQRLREDGTAELVDYAAVDTARSPLVKLVRRIAGRDAALAVLGFTKRRDYDAIFTNGENVGIPLALLLKLSRRRPRHVTIGHRLSTGKKRLFFTLLKAHRQIDTLFVYAGTQLNFAREQLGIPSKTLGLIPFHADDHFFRPADDRNSERGRRALISSAGLEWRDYPTLIEAVRDMTNVDVKLAAASPWSKHNNETDGRDLPPHVDARRYDYAGLRDLYAASDIVVVPLYENDFQAGITTILEAMAMAKPVVVTRTTGQTDTIVDGVNGLYVPAGDARALRSAIERLLGDPGLRQELGHKARTWLEANATLGRWVDNVAGALDNGDAQLEKVDFREIPKSRSSEF